MKRLTILAGICAALAACGGSSNTVEGDAAFDVKRARAARMGTGSITTLQVLMADTDFTCDQLKALTSGAGATSFFATDFLIIDYVDQGAKSYSIYSPLGTGDGGAPPLSAGSLAVFNLPKVIDAIAVSGSIDVSASSTTHVTGKFDTHAADLRALTSSPRADAQGNVSLTDGGTVAGVAVSGSFDVDVCP